MRELLDLSIHISRPPALYTGLDNAFWIDPYIASQMLQAHLDPATDAASYRPALIDETVAWLAQHLGLQAGHSLLDLGCGPGLYTRRWSERGLQVTGVDFSQYSLFYACEHDPRSTYYCHNYLDLALGQTFDVVTLISRDLCALTPEQAAQVLGVVRSHLRAGGAFAFDVTTRYQHLHGDSQAWSVHPEGGFWSPDPYLLMTRHHEVPAADAVLDQSIIIGADWRTQVYHNWLHYFSAQSITALLEANGFVEISLYSDLMGTPLYDNSKVIGVVAHVP